MTRLIATILLGSLQGAMGLAQQELTENTMRLGEGGRSQPASIQDVAWLAGQWRGEGLGGVVEEAWAPPLGGTMMGMFRLVDEGEVNFYELMVIQEVEETLLLRVKHFSSDFEAWEEKDQSVDFRLIRLGEKKAYFSPGLTIHRVDENSLHTYLAMRSRDGTLNERFMNFKRTGSEAAR